MTCANVQRLISCYLDGEIGHIDYFTIKLHIKNCPCCSKEFLELHKVKELISKKNRKAIQDFSVERLYEAILNRKQTVSWLVGMGDLAFRFIPVQALVIVLLTGFLFLGSSSQAGNNLLATDLLNEKPTTIHTALGLILGK